MTVVALTAEVTVFDLRFGGGAVRDRYLFYVAPLVLAGFACALTRRPWPRRSLITPVLLVAVGFGVAKLPRYDKLNADSPVSVLDNALVRSSHSLAGARVFLVAATLLLAACSSSGPGSPSRSWRSRSLRSRRRPRTRGCASSAFPTRRAGR